MTHDVARKPLDGTSRLVILGMLVGLAFGIWATVFVPRLWHGGKEGAVQRGVGAEDAPRSATGSRSPSAGPGAEDEEAGDAPRGLTLRDLDSILPRRLTTRSVLAHGGRFTKLEFAGTTYWMLEVDGIAISVSHKQIGIYAPDADGAFRLCLIAESWNAHSPKATVDKETGILELRVGPNSTSQGQLILSCNLRNIGTPHSIREK